MEELDFLVLNSTHLSPLDKSVENYSDGFLLAIDKPYKWTSSDVVRKVKFTLKRHFHHDIKVGHAGTLDPLATGVLILCVGKATKSAEKIQAGRKEYVAEITLGATTPSYDMEKEIDAEYPYLHITEESVQNALKSFIGKQKQHPPIFSAKYVDGIRAYERARSGEIVELQPSLIEIFDIELLGFSLPKFSIRVVCSKGTYIRALARDLGTALNSGAYLSSLRRSASGPFRVEDCMSMEHFIGLFKES